MEIKNTIPNTDDDAKRIIVGIVHEAGGVFTGKTRLYKAFWKAHSIYWQQNGRHLTDHPIVHMTRGPGIDGGDRLLRELVKKDRRLENPPVIMSWSERYRLAAGADVKLSGLERAAIRDALSWLGDSTATECSQRAHKESREWREAEEAKRSGVELNYELDSIPDDRLAQMRKRLSSIEPLTQPS